MSRRWWPALLALLLLLAVAGRGWAADRFWVGDGGDAAAGCPACTHWSASTGGSPGATAPDATTPCHFDAASFTTTAQSVTTDFGLACAGIDWTGAAHSPTFVTSGNVDFTGNLTLIAGMSIDNSIGSLFTGHGGGTITSAGQDLVNLRLTDGGTWNLADDLLVSGCSTQLLSGTFNTNDHTVSGCIDVSGGSAVLNGGTSTFHIDQFIDGPGFTGTLNMATATLQIPYNDNLHGPTIRCSAGEVFGALVLNDLPSSSDLVFFGDQNCSIGQFTVNSGTGTGINGGAGLQIGTFTCNGTSAGVHLAIQNFVAQFTNPVDCPFSDVGGTSGCCIGGGCPATTSGSCYAGAGGSVNATSGAPYDSGTLLGGWLAEDPPTPTPTATITPTPTPTFVTCLTSTRYVVDTCAVANVLDYNNVACWSCTSGGAGGAGPPDRTLDMRADALSFTVDGETLDMAFAGNGPTGYPEIRSMDWTGVLHAPAFKYNGAGKVVYFGNVTLSAGMTLDESVSSCDDFDFDDDPTGTTHTFQPAGLSICSLGVGESLAGSGAGPQVHLAGALSYDPATSGGINVFWGTLFTEGFAVSGYGITISDNGPTADTGIDITGSTVTMGGVGASFGWAVNAGSVSVTTHITTTGSTIIVADGASFVFQGAGYTYNALTDNNTVGTAFQSTAPDTFADITLTPGVPVTVAVGLITGTMHGAGTSGAHVTLSSDNGPGSPWTLTCSGLCAGDYWDVTDSDCSGGTTCYAGSHGTVDVYSALHNWVPADPPATPTPTPTATKTAPPGCQYVVVDPVITPGVEPNAAYGGGPTPNPPFSTCDTNIASVGALFSFRQLDSGTYAIGNVLLRYLTSVLPDGVIGAAWLRSRGQPLDQDGGTSVAADWFNWGPTCDATDYTTGAPTGALSVGGNCGSQCLMANLPDGEDVDLQLDDPAINIDRAGSTYLRMTTAPASLVPTGINYYSARNGVDNTPAPRLVVELCDTPTPTPTPTSFVGCCISADLDSCTSNGTAIICAANRTPVPMANPNCIATGSGLICYNIGTPTPTALPDTWCCGGTLRCENGPASCFAPDTPVANAACNGDTNACETFTPTPTPTGTATPTATFTPCPGGRCPHVHRPFWLGRDQGITKHNEETQGR